MWMVVELFCFILILAYQHLFMTHTFILTGEHFSPAKFKILSTSVHI